ncbi:MAG: TetR family transcriptional regulator [Dongiaceae bacterium]
MASTSRKKKSAGPTDIVAAALKLAAERGWRAIALADIAAAAGISLAELHGRYPSKQAILQAFSRDIDRQVVAGGDRAGADESARDRLFDVMMRRFDALAPHRDGVAAVFGDVGRDPLAALCGAGQLLRSMALMLETAGISSSGLLGAIRTKGLAAIHLATMRDWLRDDTADKAKTMAALDARLRRAEQCANSMPHRRSSPKR